MHLPSLENGFDDKLDFSPLFEVQKRKRMAPSERSATPLAVEAEDEPDEYELFFTLVSDDGFRRSGKDLEQIWNNVIDQLPVDGNFPGAAHKQTRPDVYQGNFVKIWNFYYKCRGRRIIVVASHSTVAGAHESPPYFSNYI